MNLELKWANTLGNGQPCQEGVTLGAEGVDYSEIRGHNRKQADSRESHTSFKIQIYFLGNYTFVRGKEIRLHPDRCCRKLHITL